VQPNNLARFLSMIEKKHIDKLLVRMTEIETELSDPATAKRRDLYKKLVREHSRLKNLSRLAGYYFELADDLAEHRELMADDSTDSELRELAHSEISAIEEKLPIAEKALTIALLPPDPDDERNAIMEIRAGTGGDEASLFAADLFRMYSRYAELMSW
jgi:peptide chain release factor 1